jgi:A/G-specific adenine glycosylase
MKTDRHLKGFFTQQLLQWHHDENTRCLPWKSEKAPYKIWLSEIILQQTRAEQGLPYYLRFTESFPTIKDLSLAKDEDVFRLWQGLGYYNRCKNLLATARFIADELDGNFPNSYEAILQLKGVGPYTAAAIASFAYDLPHAVVDGNVYRVLSRYFSIETPYDSTEGKQQFQTLAQELLDKKQSAAYNQAIMDLGATVCTPAAPACQQCPLHENCNALQHDLVQMLPVKSKKIITKKRFFHYLLLLSEDERLWISKRMGKDIWQNLFQPFLIEHHSSLDVAELRLLVPSSLLKQGDTLVYEGVQKQRLTHQFIETKFFSTTVKRDTKIEGAEGEWVKLNELKKFPFPKTIVSFLEKKLYF